MSNQKRYLDVPYAEKDQAKALGARWDAARKKWYIPNGIESALFQRWQPADAGGEANSPGAVKGNEKSSYARGGRKSPRPAADEHGVVTLATIEPTDPSFVPYCGVDPPWDS
ncbi:DUF5710 domain-containing protein [Methylococcus sp. EFPC2]|uniref:DUF5710 domain-containing protein n=1 Tax=Methylococcus sp. EFPC2 TaxID=2812648 RepID=UPI00196812B3|nr:DUF5710 domain-containing protein [Methylococcus sp. EFPC2]QSA95819.1 hypothetical protein JWZ97_11260 [Methylococcus sp. EFPC2]